MTPRTGRATRCRKPPVARPSARGRRPSVRGFAAHTARGGFAATLSSARRADCPRWRSHLAVRGSLRFSLTAFAGVSSRGCPARADRGDAVASRLTSSAEIADCCWAAEDAPRLPNAGAESSDWPLSVHPVRVLGQATTRLSEHCLRPDPGSLVPTSHPLGMHHTSFVTDRATQRAGRRVDESLPTCDDLSAERRP